MSFASNEVENTIWIEQTPPSTSDTTITQIESPVRTTASNETNHFALLSLGNEIPQHQLQQQNIPEILAEDIVLEDCRKISINKTPSITIDNTVASTDRSVIFPDAKEWGNSEYTESSKADDDLDDDMDDVEDDGSLTTLATSTISDLNASHLHLRSRGVMFPAIAIADGTIDPTTATIVAAVRAVSRVAEGESGNNKNEISIEPIIINVKANESNLNVDRHESIGTEINLTNYSAQQSEPKPLNSTTSVTEINVEKLDDSIKKLINDSVQEAKNISIPPNINVVTNHEANNTDLKSTSTNSSDEESIQIVNYSLNSSEKPSNTTSIAKNVAEELNEAKKDLNEITENTQLTNILNDLTKFDEDYKLSKSNMNNIKVEPIIEILDRKNNDIPIDITSYNVDSSINNVSSNVQGKKDKENKDEADIIKNNIGLSITNDSHKTNDIVWITEVTPNIPDLSKDNINSNNDSINNQKNANNDYIIQINDIKNNIEGETNDVNKGINDSVNSMKNSDINDIACITETNDNIKASDNSDINEVKIIQNNDNPSVDQYDRDIACITETNNKSNNDDRVIDNFENSIKNINDNDNIKEATDNSNVNEMKSIQKNDNASDDKNERDIVWIIEKNDILNSKTVVEEAKDNANDIIKDSTKIENDNKIENNNNLKSTIKNEFAHAHENEVDRTSDIVWITEDENNTPPNKNIEDGNEQAAIIPIKITNEEEKNNETIVSKIETGSLKVRFHVPEDEKTKNLDGLKDKTAEDYTEFIDEYERNLRKHTCETLDLVDRLCEKSTQKLNQPLAKQSNGQSTENRVSWSGEIFTNDSTDINNVDLDIDSLRINPNLMVDPIDCLMLPGRRLIIFDNELGILLVNLETKHVIRSSEASQSSTTKWRYPKCGAYVSETDQILVLAECCSIIEKSTNEPSSSKSTTPPVIPTLASILEPKPTDYNLFICRFDAKTLRLENRVEAPKFIRDKIVSRCQMCYVEATKCVYLTVSTPNDAFMYELNADCRWSEVYNRRGRTFSDLQYFAVIGPVTELLVLETNKQHVLMLSIYESEVVSQRMIAICERPDSLAVDENGAVFAFDQVRACVAQHSRLYFDRMRNIALIERAHCRLSANGRLLAVLVRGFKQLKIYKY